jgi:hypothetical protein
MMKLGSFLALCTVAAIGASFYTTLRDEYARLSCLENSVRKYDRALKNATEVFDSCVLNGTERKTCSRSRNLTVSDIRFLVLTDRLQCEADHE